MNKEKIYELFFEEIYESTEWGNNCKENNYAWYIDGAASFTKRLLEELDKPTEYSIN